MTDLHEVLRRINESLARIRQFRPLWKHEYSADPLLTLEEVEGFERTHSCRLPETYREFLMHVGNGGAGPDCGLFALGQHFPGSGHEECLEEDVDLSMTFPHCDAWNEAPGSPEFEDDARYFSPAHAAGSLMIADLGCGSCARLVVTGPLAGEIWNDMRHDGLGIFPHLAPDGSRSQFLPWYQEWLARQVYQFGHQGRPRPDPGPGGGGEESSGNI